MPFDLDEAEVQRLQECEVLRKYGCANEFPEGELLQVLRPLSDLSADMMFDQATRHA